MRDRAGGTAPWPLRVPRRPSWGSAVVARDAPKLLSSICKGTATAALSRPEGQPLGIAPLLQGPPPPIRGAPGTVAARDMPFCLGQGREAVRALEPVSSGCDPRNAVPHPSITPPPQSSPVPPPPPPGRQE